MGNLFENGTLCYVKNEAWDKFYERYPDACNVAKPHQARLALVSNIHGNKIVLKGIPHYYWEEHELVRKDGATVENKKEYGDDYEEEDVKLIPPKALLKKYEKKIEKWIDDAYASDALLNCMTISDLADTVTDDRIVDEIDVCSEYTSGTIEDLKELVNRKIRQMGYFEKTPIAIVSLELHSISDDNNHKTRIMKPFDQMNSDQQDEFLESFGVSRSDFECDSYDIENFEARIEFEEDQSK
jgi:hypothetical protein